jgi:hypothetical protein
MYNVDIKINNLSVAHLNNTGDKQFVTSARSRTLYILPISSNVRTSVLYEYLNINIYIINKIILQ